MPLQAAGRKPQGGHADRLIERQVVVLVHVDGRGGGRGDGDAGGEGDARRAADLAGEEPGHRRGQRTDDRERNGRREGRGSQQPHRRQLDDRRQRHPVRVARDRQHRIGWDAPADVDERPDEVDVETRPGVEGASHVHVVVRVGVGGIGMHAEENGPDDQGKGVQSDGDPHGEAA